MKSKVTSFIAISNHWVGVLVKENSQSCWARVQVKDGLLGTQNQEKEIHTSYRLVALSAQKEHRILRNQAQVPKMYLLFFSPIHQQFNIHHSYQLPIFISLSLITSISWIAELETQSFQRPFHSQQEKFHQKNNGFRTMGNIEGSHNSIYRSFSCNFLHCNCSKFSFLPYGFWVVWIISFSESSTS